MSKFDIFGSQEYKEGVRKGAIREAAEILSDQCSFCVFHTITSQGDLQHNIKVEKIDHISIYDNEFRKELISKFAPSSDLKPQLLATFTQAIFTISKANNLSLTKEELNAVASFMWDILLSSDLPTCTKSTLKKVIIDFLSSRVTVATEEAVDNFNKIDTTVLDVKTKTIALLESEKEQSEITWTLQQRQQLSEVMDSLIIDIPAICSYTGISRLYVELTLLDTGFNASETINSCKIKTLLKFLHRFLSTLPNEIAPSYKEQSLKNIYELLLYIGEKNTEDSTLLSDVTCRQFLRPPFNQYFTKEKVIPPVTLLTLQQSSKWVNLL